MRQHLATLERDGLIRQEGERPGTRKPHLLYYATEEAESLFPKVYDLVLNQLLSTMKNSLDPQIVEKLLSEAGKGLAGSVEPDEGAMSFEDRLACAVETVSGLGGCANVQVENGRTYLCGVGRCPLRSVTGEHPEICDMVAAALTAVVGLPVTHACENENDEPKCRFEVHQA